MNEKLEISGYPGTREFDILLDGKKIGEVGYRWWPSLQITGIHYELFSHRGNGYARSAVRLLIKKIFNERHKSVYAVVNEHNHRSINLVFKVGFHYLSDVCLADGTKGFLYKLSQGELK
jgi:RimJ/RimL family protein N-acetyltransferase